MPEQQSKSFAVIERLASLTERLAALAEKALDREVAQEAGLSDREQRVCEALGDGEMTGEQLAKVMDLEFSGSFRQDLAAMVTKKILINKRPRYRVAR